MPKPPLKTASVLLTGGNPQFPLASLPDMVRTCEVEKQEILPASKIICAAWIGRFGNRCHSYLYGKHIEQAFGCKFFIPSPWEGSVLFENPAPVAPIEFLMHGFCSNDGTVHSYEYDKLGRQIEDKVITSHSAVRGGSVVNEVQLTYNPHGLLLRDYQAHSGAVNTGTTPKAAYDYTSGAGNKLRRTKVTYPGGSELNSKYGSTNSVDDHFNRVGALEVGGESHDLVQYVYAGINWPVVVTLPATAALELTSKRLSGDPVADAGDIYAGFDRFGRPCDLRWRYVGGADVERIQYGFDRNSRRTWRRRATTQLWDRAYNYDSLSQVIAEDRGDINLNQTAIAGIPESGSRWTFDKTGNWAGYETLADGSATLEQARQHDKGNRLTGISDAASVTVDRAGRMTQVPASTDWSAARQIKWDAWSRIVEVRDGETVIAAYAYDGLARRIKTTIGSAARETYYSDTWKPLEDGDHKYYWGARHRDDLVRRDGASDQHLVLMDYFSPAAVADTEGDVVERYDFSAFGLRTVLAPNFTVRTASDFDFTFAFQGQFQDSETGWLNCGYRYYLPALGRWASKDPIMENGGTNLYAIAANNLLNMVDHYGLAGCSPNEKRNCKVVSYDFMSQQSRAAEKSFELASSAHELMGKMSFASSAAKVALGAGKVLDKMAQMAENATTEATPDAIEMAKRDVMKVMQMADRLPGVEITLSMTISYEECECGFLSNNWVKKTHSGQDGPFKGMPQFKSMLIDMLEARLCAERGVPN